MAIGVMREDSIIFSKAYGFADLEYEIPLPANASFQIGSITKQFTAVGIMQLAEKGILDLDENISEYIQFEHKEYDPTIRQLLNHTSGIRGHNNLPGFRPLLMREIIRDTIIRLVEKEPFDFVPGTAMLYSNTGYIILGLIIEKLTGQTYEEYTAEHILSKAGMENTFFCDRTAIRKLRAHGYNFVDGGKYRAEEPYYYWTYSAGALCSTIEDLLKWNNALHDGNVILNKVSYAELIKPEQLENGIKLRYAKGLQRYRKNGHEVIAHGGSGSGILAELMYFPEKKISLVTLENSYRRENWFAIADALVDELIPVTIDRTAYEGDLSTFRGTYEGNWQVRIENTDNHLLIENEGATIDTLSYVGGDRWSSKGNEYFFTKGNGGEQYLHMDMIYALFSFTKKE